MKRFAVLLSVCSLAACTSAPPPRPQPQPPQPQAAQPPARRSPNALAAVAQTRAIKEPRIRVGLLSDQPQSRGYGTNMLVVKRSADQPFDKKLTITDDEGETTTLAADSVLLLPQTEETIDIGDKPYRTAARVWINSRGTLNVINELN